MFKEQNGCHRSDKRQVYDTKEEAASEILAKAIKIQNKGTAEALKNRMLLSISFSQWLLRNSS